MPESYSVQLAKEAMVFSAAHFITFDGNICERLHGHNYRVTVDIAGPLDKNRYVVDFIALRDSLQAIVLTLDHHMLLPTRHPLISVVANDSEVNVRFEDRRWVFPLGDCVLLPIENTTTELLAQHIGRQLMEVLAAKSGFLPARLRIAVDENHGQWGIWEHEPAVSK